MTNDWPFHKMKMNNYERMMKLHTIIVNPTSGRGLAIQKLPELEKMLQTRNIEYRLIHAQTPEEATQAAQDAVQANADAIIALGGDGTFFRVINGMAGSDVPLLFGSCGTGNDFVRSLNLPRDPLEALRVQLDAPVSRIDVGRMNEYCFLNVSGTGFDVDVLRKAEKHKKKHSGLRAYLYGLYDAIKSYKPLTAMVSIDGEQEEPMSFAIVSIGNGRYFGGGMKAVPHAEVSDGLFDVVMVKPVRKFAILPLIAFYIAGKHIDLKLASLRRCRRIVLKCEGMTLNLDGELRNADVARFELMEAALAVRIPGNE